VTYKSLTDIKAIEYFVDHEMYEDAVKAKKAKDLFQESK
jgi:hypothetical protein